MAKFEINKTLSGAGDYKASIEAAQYKQEGEYFVFYADASRMKKVLTVRASLVSTVDTEPGGKK